MATYYNKLNDGNVEQYGNATYSGAGTTVTVSTNLKAVVCGEATTIGSTVPAAEDRLAITSSIATQTFTITRAAAGTADLQVWYRVIGLQHT